MPDAHGFIRPGSAAPFAVTTGAPGQVAVRGEVDVSTAPLLLAALTDASAAAGVEIDVDFAAVTFLDSTGLNALVEARSRAHSAGKRIVIRNASDRVMRVFTITGLDEIFLRRLDESQSQQLDETPS